MTLATVMGRGMARTATLRASFAFPLQSPVARREVLWGALLLVALPGVGWLLNMGHRIAVTVA